MKRPPRFELDFVGGRRLGGAAGWFLILGGLAVVLAAALDWRDARDETERWEAKAAQRSQLARRAVPGGSGAATPAELEQAAKAVARLSIPWGAFYRALEDSAHADVSLLAVVPNADKREVQLSGEARDFASLRAYLQRLGESGVLSDVRLLNQETRESDAQKPVVFSLVAAWRWPT
jgi:Tfp pilus assembly protein PilN